MDKLERVMSVVPPLPEGMVDDLPKEWLDLLARIYEWHRKSRLRELNGGIVKPWRGDGLHEPSYLWGRLDAMTPEGLVDALATHATVEHPFSPQSVRIAAIADATDEYADRLTRERAPARAPSGEKETTEPETD